MLYKDFGTTSDKVSILGFGCMRLPMTQKDGISVVDDEKNIPLLQKAVELGINFFDSHWFYCNFDSQRAVGKALSPVRKNVLISSKTYLRNFEKAEDFDMYLEKTLELMGLDYLDYYHLPALSYQTWTQRVLPMKLLDRAEKAKSKGLIRHLSFSFHSDPDKMRELIDTEAFSSMLGQYNLADRRNEEVFSYAKKKGVGTMVMGPLMGGVLTDGGNTFVKKMQSQASCAAEMALRFVWGLPAVDMILSGMSNLSQLEENIAFAKAAGDVTAQEWQALVDRSHELKELSDLYCTNCNYCAGCPKDIRIGRIFQLYIQHKNWGLSESVKKRISPETFGNPRSGENPSKCTACGECTPKCPQGIDVPGELKRVWEELSSL